MVRIILVLAACLQAEQLPLSLFKGPGFEIPVEDRGAYIPGFRSTSDYRLYFYTLSQSDVFVIEPNDTNFADIQDYAIYSGCSEDFPSQRSFALRWGFSESTNSIFLQRRCDNYRYGGVLRNSCTHYNESINCPMATSYPASFPGAQSGQSGRSWVVNEFSPISMKISISEGFLEFVKPPGLVLPELLVDSLQAFWEPGMDSILFAYRVVNWSSKTSPAHDIEIVYNAVALGKEKGDSLSGQFFTKYALFLPWQKDLTTIQIRIDPDKTIREVTKANNSVTESWDTRIPVSIRPGLMAGAVQVWRGGRRDILGRRAPLSGPVPQPLLKNYPPFP